MNSEILSYRMAVQLLRAVDLSSRANTKEDGRVDLSRVFCCPDLQGMFSEWKSVRWRFRMWLLRERNRLIEERYEDVLQQFARSCLLRDTSKSA